MRIVIAVDNALHSVMKHSGHQMR